MRTKCTQLLCFKHGGAGRGDEAEAVPASTRGHFRRLRSSGLILEQDRVEASPRSSSLRDELGKGGS